MRFAGIRLSLEGERKVDKQQATILEEKYLQKTIKLAEEQLQQAKKAIEGKQEELIEAKRAVREDATHRMDGNLYNSDNFEALAELSQCMTPVQEILADCEEEQRKIFRLEKLLKKPYFARIDFRFEEEEEAEQIYIGRSSLIEKATKERVVYDWRSPIASVFYRFMTGKACYDAPGGRMEGEVTLKRQYEISDGKLEYFFDTDRNISDEFLKQMLSKNTSPQMKAIVETIQKEQDVVIRDIGNSLLMVQGVAGSGKTSIALHRAAYLMYQGLQAKLAANSILIISPNTMFEQYISNVLPELGEDNVESAVFEDLFDEVFGNQLNGWKLQTKNEFLEHAVTNHSYKEVVKDSMECKNSRWFKELLDQKLAQIPRGAEVDAVELYREIFGEPDCAVKLEAWEAQEKLDAIWDYTRENLESGSLYYDDMIAIFYLHLKRYGAGAYYNIRQVVIDEAQDYYPLQYEIFHLLFPNAKFTVLGDINQTLAKREDMSLYETIRNILDKKNASVITLNKSFRCTNEILEFGLQFVEHRPEIHSFNRAGDRPEVIVADTQEKLVNEIVREVNVCREKGFQTICLICKTEKNAEKLYEQLNDKMELQLITDKNVERLEGIFIMPVYMSKGLEFDAVVLCDVDAQNYYEEDDRKLLYVECTRALHRLSLMCEGELSPLVKA